MKRSWHKFGRAPRRGRSHATAALVGEPFVAGSGPGAFRSAGRAVIRPVDQHREYLERRWQRGCRNAAQLWRELREQGFSGQSRIVREWVRSTLVHKVAGGRQPSVSIPLRSSPRQVAWLLLKQPEDARPYLEELVRQSLEIATCASLALEFCRIVRQRDTAAWSVVRDAAPASPLANFAKHLCRDETPS